MYNSIKGSITGEYSEKKSKFIANGFYITSEEEAKEKLDEIRKKYFDAKHNCYAYRVFENGQLIEKMSDDGEPSGTAGGPMLNILKGKNICNYLIIVTRYFGGILLGTGGLVRAYSEALNNALEGKELQTINNGISISFEIDYADLKNLQYYCQNNDIFITNQEFVDTIKINANLSNEKLEKLQKKIDTLNFKIKNLKLGAEIMYFI